MKWLGFLYASIIALFCLLYYGSVSAIAAAKLLVVP